MNVATDRITPSITTMIRMDHSYVMSLFHRYRADTSPGKKRALVTNACLAIQVHAQLEEEIFYPALRDAIKETDLLDEAEVEHGTAKDLIAQLEGSTEADEMFDAKVKVLGEYIDHHVKEERNEIFVKARAAKELDLVVLRDQLTTRKEELMEELMGATA